MKRFRATALASCLLVIGACAFTGCAPLKSFFGIVEKDTDGDGKPDAEAAEGSWLTTALGYFVPGADTLLVAIGAIWVGLKGKKYKAALLSTVEAVEIFKSSPAGKPVWESLKKELGESHALAKVTSIVEAALHKMKIESAVAPVPKTS